MLTGKLPALLAVAWSDLLDGTTFIELGRASNPLGEP
jgi:hypothetical protein